MILNRGRSLVGIWISLVAVVFAAVCPLRAIQDSDVSDQMSPQSALDYAMQLAKPIDDDARSKRRTGFNGLPENIVLSVDLQNPDSNKKLSQVGVANLIFIKQAAGSGSKLNWEMAFIVNLMADEALKLKIAETDLPVLLQNVPQDSSLWPLIFSKPQWCMSPEVVALAGSELSRIAGNTAAGTAEDQSGLNKAMDSSNSSGTSGRTKNLGDSPDLSRLLTQIDGTGNPMLTGKISALIKDMAQNPGNYPFSTFCNVLEFYAYRKGPNVKPDAYDAYLADLILTKDQSEQGTRRFDKVADNSTYLRAMVALLPVKSFVCADTRIQDSVIKDVTPMMRNSFMSMDARRIAALLGDSASFHELVRQLNHSVSRGSDVNDSLITSMQYQGPDAQPGDKLKAIAANVDLCKFDTTLGKWVLIVPGYENQTSANSMIAPAQ